MPSILSDSNSSGIKPGTVHRGGGGWGFRLCRRFRGGCGGIPGCGRSGWPRRWVGCSRGRRRRGRSGGGIPAFRGWGRIGRRGGVGMLRWWGRSGLGARWFLSRRAGGTAEGGGRGRDGERGCERMGDAGGKKRAEQAGLGWEMDGGGGGD